MKQDMIVILDLGSEENPRLAREIRALGVYSEIHPHDITLEELGRALGCRAVSIPTDGGGCCKAMLSTHKRKTIKFKR